MAGFGAKVKLSVDKSNKAEFNNQINSMINQIKISNKFVVLQKDMAAVTKSIEAGINQNPIKIKRIDCSAAVSDMRRQLQTMIDSLSIKNNVRITGLKDPSGSGALNSGLTQTVTNLEEAEAAMERYNTQLKILQTAQKSLDSVFKSISSGSKMLKDASQLKSIQAEYDALIQKIQGFKNASETERNAIIESARGLQEKITVLQREQTASEKAAAAAEKRAAAEERARAAEERETANLKQYYSLLTQIQRAQDTWTKSKNGTTSGQYAQLGIYSDELKTLFTQLQNGTKSIAEFNAGIADVGTRFAATSTQIRAAGENTKSLLDRFGTLGQKFTSWLTVSQVIMLVIRSIKQMISAVKELDSALTQIEIVTGTSGAALQKFANQAATVAKSTGATITDIVSSTETFARLGYTLDQSLVLSEVTGKYANVAATTIDDATASLTSIMKAFRVAPEEMSGVVDELVKVGQEYAVSAGELGEALQNGGAALEAGGNTLEQSIALIAAGNAAVQDASAVGNALKTTSMRIRSSTAELEEMGETVDDLVKSASAYRAEIKALSGVDIMFDDENYKSTYQILREIADVWEEMTDIQQATLLEDLAGKRNANVVKSIITNLQDLEGAYHAASNAAGTLEQANDVYMNSIEAKVKQFKATFQEFSSSLFDSSLLKGIVDLGTGLFGMLTALEKIHVLLPAIVASLTIIKALQVAKSSVQSVSEIVTQYTAQKVVTQDLMNSIRALNAVEKDMLKTRIEAMIAAGTLTAEEGGAIIMTLGLAAAEGTATAATDGLAISFKSLMASIPIFGWIALGISVLIELIPVIENATEQWGKSSEAVLKDLNSEFSEISGQIQSVANDFRTLKESADDVIPRFAELSKGVDQFGNNVSLSESQYKEFLDLNNQIAEMFPELNLGMDSNGNAMLALSGDADTLTQSLYALVEVERQAANTKIAETMPDVLSNIRDTDKQLKRQLSSLEEQKDALITLYNSIGELQDTRMTQASINSKKSLYESLGIKMELSNPQQRRGVNWIYDVSYSYDQDEVARNYENLISGIEREIDSINRSIEANHSKVNPVISAWMQTDFNFQELSSDMQRAVQTMVSNIDFQEMGLTTESAIQDFVTDNIIIPIRDASPEVQSAFSDLLSLTPQITDLSWDDYIAKINATIQKIADNTDFSFNDVLKNTGFDQIIERYSAIRNEIFRELQSGITTDASDWQQYNHEMTELVNRLNSFSPSELTRAYEIVKDYGIKTWDELISAMENRTFDVVLSYDTESTGLESLTSAIKESTEATGLSSEAIENLRARYADLEGYDPSRLFEKTANGIHLNTVALNELEDAYVKQNKATLDNKLGGLIEQYNKLTDEIDACGDATKRIALYNQRNNLFDQIQETATLAAQYEGLTSAYNKWIQAQSAGNERDMYESIISGQKSLEESMSRGWLGDDEKAFIQLLSASDLATASITDYIEAYNRLKQEIGSSGYNVFDFFTEDENGKSTSEGIYNFFDTVRHELGETYAWIDEHGGYHLDFGIGGDQEIANALGINVEAVQAILRAAADAGFDVNLDSLLSQLDLVKTGAEQANEALVELGVTDVHFNFNTDDITELNTQISSAKELYDSLANEDGTLKVGVDEATAEDARLILATLISEKQKLVSDDTVVMHVRVDSNNVQSDAEKAVLLLQDLQREYNNLELSVALNVDSTESQTKIQEIANQIDALPENVKALLGLDTSDLDEAIESISETEINVEAGINLDQESIDVLLAAISEISPEMLVEAGIDATAIDGYEPPEKDMTVNLSINDAAVVRYQPPTKQGLVRYTAKLNDWVVPVRYGRVIYSPDYRQPEDENQSRAGGTAFSNGERNDGDALGGELGTEILVRDGRFYTIGEDSAEFFRYRKGDIIFNAEQSKQLLKTGKIRFGKKRGTAFLEGNAFSDADGPGRDLISGAITPTVDPVTLPVTPVIDKTAMTEELEELCSEIQSEIDSAIADYEYRIFVLQRQNAPASEIIAVYREMQQYITAQADRFRSLGLTENDEFIRDLKKQWWEYADSIKDVMQDAYDALIQDYEHSIFIMEKNNSDPARIIETYRKMQAEAHRLSEEYRALGLSENDDLIQELQKQWWDFEDEIADVKEQAVQDLLDIVDAASELVDTIQDINDTLHEAANEYAANGGFISIDSFQRIVELGPQYLQYLKDENGLLVINDERINQVLAAKTQELALETALAYVERLRLAKNSASIDQLNELLYATRDATDATWGLVYANLALVDLNDDQYAAAIHNLDALRSLADNAIAGIGTAADSTSKVPEEMRNGLNDILKYVMDMLKQRINDQIDALKDMKDAYKDIINLRKEALKAAKDEADYQDKIADKMKQINELQRRITALSRDDSRSAANERAKLEEDMLKLQKELADEQAEYATDAQNDALDEMQKAYENEKDAEIAVLQNSISSYQKLYDMAIQYIQDHWNTLYSELISWNTEYGSVLNSEITTAWDNCLIAAQRYGSYVAALGSIDSDIQHYDTVSNSGTYDHGYTDDDMSKARSRLTGSDDMVQSEAAAYQANQYVSHMKQNSRDWRAANSGSDADEKKRRDLEAENRSYAAGIGEVLYGNSNALRLGSDGWWYLPDGRKLYEVYTGEYHKGGIAGEIGTMKQNEVIAKLEEGEMILDQPKQKAMYQIIDFTSAISEKLGRAIKSIDVSGLFGRMRSDVTDLQGRSLSAVTNNQSEKIHFGDVTIYGANDDTVRQHQEINRKFTNDILKLVGIKR